MQVSIFNQMYEHASQFDNELAGQPPSSLSEWLKRQRELLLTRLGECSYLDDCLSETAEAKSILLSKQMDLFIYAIKNAETAQEIRPSFAALFEHLDVFSQKLAKQLKFCTVERLIPIALFACREVLGDRRFMIAQQFIDLMRVQQEFSQARLAIKEQLVTIPKAITNDMVKLSGNMLWKINMGQLENCLSGFLNEWLESWATHPLAVEARYCTLFVSRVVREINQPSHFWELLLLRLERSLMSWSKMVTPATEVLLAAIERFDFINIVITKHQDHLQLLYPFNEIILLKMLFDARQISDLYQRWLQHTAFDSFHTLGLSADELAQRTASFTNILIENSERLHVDWLKNASDYCVAMMRAADDHQKLLSVIGHEVDIFSSKVAEGLTDSIGVKRINEQIRALFLVCRYASLATPDLLVARTLFRKSVVLALVTEQYDMVWKKHREISLALAQMDVAEQSARLNMQQVQPLMRELDSILSDVVRDGIMWWPKNFTINAYAIGMNGARGVDLTLLLVRIGLSRMMFGQRALSAVMSWQAQWLLQDTKQPVQYSLLRKTMRVVHAALDAENPSLDGVQLLEQLIRRIDEVTAVKNIPLVAESIVNNASFIGISRYADLIKSQPELSPACGNQQAWKLAIPDNLWTLNRISYIYSQGLTNPFQAFAWWWNIAIGKNLRRLPLPLLSINVDVLSLSLFDGLTSDEALGALKLIKAVYRESFGIDTDIYTTSPTAFVQTQLRGKIWQQVFATASTKGTLFSKHSKAVRAAAPAELELIATTLAELMARTGDQEGVWSHCQLLAPLFSTIVNNGTHAIEKAWLQWQNNVFVALPAGAATFWNTVLSLGLEQARQLGIAIKLQRHCEQVRQLAAIRMDEDRVQFQEASGLRTQQLNALFWKISIQLMTESPSVAALNIGRYLVMDAGTTFDFSSTNWRRLWLGMDEALRAHLDPSERQALVLWTGQLLAMTEMLTHVNPVAKELLQEPQLIFADSIDEELGWREAVSGILASALTSNTAPYSGSLMAQRLFLSCHVFYQETPITWSERRQALENAYRSIRSPLLQGRIIDRHSQIASSLFNRERLLESGDIEPTHQYSLMLSEMSWARSTWRIASFARQLDDGRVTVSHDDTLISTISRDLPPNSVSIDAVGARIKAIQKYVIQTDLVKKRWLGSQTYALTPIQVIVFRQLLVLSAMYELLPQSQIRQQAGVLLNLGFAANDYELLAIMFENIRQTSMLSIVGKKAIDDLAEQCMAAHLAQNLVQQRSAVARAIKQNSSQYKVEVADFCIVQLGLFMGNHQAIVNHHLFTQALHHELFQDNWKLARDSLALTLSASTKEMALPEPEQKMMSHFVLQAMGETA